ncbi:MAG TPA: sulfur carrier protein ThiS [Candidatus Hydrogenedentes bacterium]|nr:sulfur carrier protein ThiS [Candidatus Hydrogenedentota bacterium]
MQIVVNGAARTVADRMPLLDLLSSLGLKPESTVVEYNGAVLERPRFPELLLNEGDTLELVRFVGGG